MSTFGHKVETASKDVLKAIETPITFIGKSTKVLQTVIKDQPELKEVLAETLTQAAKISADGTAAIGANGFDLTADAKVLADAEAFFVFFKTTVAPEIVKVYGELKTDAK